MNVAAQMTRRVICASPTDLLRDARDLLMRSGLRCLPVVEAGQLVGLLFARDCPERIPDDATVRACMVEPTARVTPATPIERAAATMIEHHVHGLPVVDDAGRLVGVITVTDLLATLVKSPPITLWG